jgi:outer membrane biosynthesis protein TonB
MPDVPTNIRHLMVGSFVVDVKISVDANGQVTDAVPTSRTKGNKLGEYLGVRAAQAARLWKFDAATLDGKKVAGEMVVQFKF